MKSRFDTTSRRIAKVVTNSYSTSFSLAVRLLEPSVRSSIYAIYGFVRLADEVVDSFHDYDQEALLQEFEDEYKKSLERKISLNPVLNAFQRIVRKYQLHDLVDSFMNSMRMDLHKNDYLTEEEYKNYIFGSADVVGLMCLRVFVDNDEDQYQHLKPYAMRLGSAFQKVNFLRDYKYDNDILDRSYFPNVDFDNLTEDSKEMIIADIHEDFHVAYEGIKQLPMKCKFGVYVAYKYYQILLAKLSKKPVHEILSRRIRVPNSYKMYILFKSYVKFKLRLI